MYANTNLEVVQDNQQYKAIDGTQYPANYPKASIAELTLVTEVAQPTDETLKVTGFTVDGSYNQVWTTVVKTQQELDDDLLNAKVNRKLEMGHSFGSAIYANINFVSADATDTDYQADEDSMKLLDRARGSYPVTVPTGFYWVASDNSHTSFVSADLSGLALAMSDRLNTNFQNLQDKKAEIDAQTTVATVNAVTW